MGYNSYQIGEVGYVEIQSHTKRIAGKCPMCGKEFDIEFDLKDGPTEYTCICGYFRFDAENDSFTEDNHNIPQEDWIQRRQEAESKLSSEKVNEVKEIYVPFEIDMEDLLEMIKRQFPGVPPDQIGIFPDYDREQGCDEVRAKLTIFRKKP